jgi:DNA polymerase elongation subunit (family B)
MYQAVYYDRRKKLMHIWDDKDGHSKSPYVPYGYVKDDNGEYTHLYGFNVSRTTDITSKPFEYDVRPENRVLIDRYYESDELSSDVRVFFFDIETEKDPIRGYTENYSDPFNPINSVAFYDNVAKRHNIYILSKDGSLNNRDTDKYTLKAYRTEADLLSAFIKAFRKFAPHIIVGWNSDYFDIPYLYNRICVVLGESAVRKLSPIGIVEKREMFGGVFYNIAGVASFDYMELYKNFTFSEQPNYTLDAISKAELGRGKVAYEGSLQKLYETDVEKFIEYNIIDVDLIVAMDAKLQFIELARGICHKGHVPYSDIYMSSLYLDGASLTYMKRNKLVAPNKPKPINLKLAGDFAKGVTEIRMTDKIDPRTPGKGQLKVYKTKTSFILCEYTHYKDNVFYLTDPTTNTIFKKYEVKLSLIGAYVREPKTGLYKWVFDEDLTSLYPSIMRTLNISPETKIGKILNWDVYEYLKKADKVYFVKIGTTTERKTHAEVRALLTENQYAIAANGVMYRQDTIGFIPTLLGIWFDERVINNDLKKKFGMEGDTVKKNYYHNIQLVLKTLLNSFYGVLALGSFRFNDIDNAEAVTSTGQQIIKFSAKSVNIKYKKMMETDVDKDYVVYIDTDSLFISAEEIILKNNPSVDLYYKVGADDSISDIKHDKDIDKWFPSYSNWFDRVVESGKSIGFFGPLAKLSIGEKCVYTDNEQGKIDLYKFNAMLKSKYDPTSAAKELQASYYVIKYAKVIQSFVNDSYDMYVKRFLNLNDRPHYLKIKQEYVARDAFWVAKKRYAQWIVDNEGIPVNEIQVKGLDVVRSNFPLAFREFMETVLKDILVGTTKDAMSDKVSKFKKAFQQLPFLHIINSSSAKNLEKYAKMSKGVPVHIKACLNYNRLLDLNGDTMTQKIKNGDKVKWTYIKKNRFGFEEFALKGYDDSPENLQFAKEYIDYDEIFNSNFSNKIQDFYTALDWGTFSATINTNVKKFFTV